MNHTDFPGGPIFASAMLYTMGICPVAEELHNNSYLVYEMCMNELNDDVDLMVAAFRKVWKNLPSFASAE